MTAELPVRRPALGDQVLAGGGEVVEHVLLALAHAGAVPLLAVLGAAAQVGDRPDAAGRDPGQRLRGVGRGERDVEAAVAVEHGRPRRVRASPEPDSTNRCTGVPSADVACVSTTVTSGTSPATAACSQPVSAVGVGGVPAQHRRRRGVVGVADPGRRPALRRRADAGDAARRRGRSTSASRPDPSRGPHRQPVGGVDRVHGEHLQAAVRAVDQGDVGQHGVRLLRDDVLPGLRRPGGRVGRVGDGQPPARGVAVGHQPQPAVAGDPGRGLRVHADLELAQLRRRRPRSAIQTSSRGRGAGRRRRRPASGRRGWCARRSRWSGRCPRRGRARRRRPGRADPVAPDAAVELLLAGGHLVGGQPAHVEQLLAAGQPGDGGVAAAVDRPVDDLAGGDVEDVEAGLLVAARGELVGQPVALPRRPTRRRASSSRPGPAPSGRPARARCRRPRGPAAPRAPGPGRGGWRRPARPARPARRRRRRAPAARAGRRTPRAAAARRAPRRSARPGPRSTPGSADRRRPRASGRGRRRGVRAGPRRGRAGGRRGSASHPR